MADIDKRLRYFNGQFLEQKDFKDEQDYHIDRLRRHNRTLHTRGVAEGLEVTGAPNDSVVKVAPGTALDEEGRQIVLTDEKTISLSSVQGTTALVVISYTEVPVEPATVGNQGQETRLEERPDVIVVAEVGAPPAGTHIRLARVTVGSGGLLSAAVDNSVRELAGVRLNERVVTSAALADNAVITNKIANNAVTTAKIADAGVTTAKLADTSVTTAKLANSSVTNNQLANNAVTGAKIADATINEVKLDAATRAKLGGGGLGSGGTVNGPLNVLGDLKVAGSIGGFGLDQIHATTLPFNHLSSNGLSHTVPVSFIPRVVLLTGGVSGAFPNGTDTRFGGTIYGFAYRTVTFGGGGGDTSFLREATIVQDSPPILEPDDVPPPPGGPVIIITQFGHGPTIERTAGGLIRQEAGSFSTIAGATFLNRGVSPAQGTTIRLDVTSMVVGGVTFQLSRTLTSPATTLIELGTLSFNVIILGHLDPNTF